MRASLRLVHENVLIKTLSSHQMLELELKPRRYSNQSPSEVFRAALSKPEHCEWKSNLKKGSPCVNSNLQDIKCIPVPALEPGQA